MNCTRAKKAIQLYIDGYLPVEREEELFAHLDSCPGCRQYYDDMMLIYEAMEAPEREVPYGFRAAWQDEIAATGKKKRIFNFKVAVPVFAACVCGLLVTSAVVLGANNNLFSSETEAPVTASQEAKATFEIEQLDDGIQPVIVPAENTAVTDGNGMLEEDTIMQESADPTGAAQGTIIQSETSPQPTATASPSPTQQPVQAQNGVNALSPVPVIIDATGKTFRQELIEYAKANNVTVTENEMGSVVLQAADTAAINQVLTNFQLEPVADGNTVTVEILF